MKRNQQGVGAITVVIAVIVLALIAGAGYYVWLQRTNDTGTYTPKSKQTPENPLELTESKVPEGWKVAHKATGQFVLNNEKTGCSASANHTTDTAESNSPDIDQNKKTIEGIRSKGYTVTESTGKLSITTSKGTQELDALVLAVDGFGSKLSQKYAHVAKTGSLSRVSISCPAAADLPVAEKALQAVTFKEL
jgi:hypothetical protein